MWNDLRLALRGFRRSPGFALIAIATLSLGIAAILSVVDSLLLRPRRARTQRRLQPGPGGARRIIASRAV